MTRAAEELRTALAESLPALRRLTEDEVTRDRGAGKWVKKEILGHLIDSAFNNEQRFVRAQMSGRLAFPDYQQDSWVALQRYRERPWIELVDLWEPLNWHIAHVMAGVETKRLATPCAIGDDDPVTLEWLMSDYVRHLRHHLAQILG